jgi:hypothetical protein
MSINEIWRVRGNEWAWTIPNYCTLLDAAYLVLGEEPASPKADHPGRVSKVLSEMKTAITNTGEYPFPYINYNVTPFICRDTPPETIKVSANFVRRWAARYQITDFFELPNPENNQKENLKTEKPWLSYDPEYATHLKNSKEFQVWWRSAWYFAEMHKDNDEHGERGHEQLAKLVYEDFEREGIEAQGKRGSPPSASSILKAFNGIQKFKKDSKTIKRF